VDPAEETGVKKEPPKKSGEEKPSELAKRIEEQFDGEIVRRGERGKG